MNKTRFLRDSILDEMLEEIRQISDQVSRHQLSPLLFFNSFIALTEMYETNKTVLKHLEKSIEVMRNNDSPPESIDPVVESATHIQMGLINVHSTLKKDIEDLLNSIEDLKENLKIK